MSSAMESVISRENEYIRYSGYIGDILSHCSCSIDATSQADFVVLARAIEVADRLIDDTPDARVRQKHRSQIMQLLRGEGTHIPPSIGSSIEMFRDLLVQKGRLSEVCSIIEWMFSFQERMRVTKDISHYVTLSLEEGKGMGALIVEVMREKTNATSRKILQMVAPPANLLDHVIDAKCDYESGEIAFIPNGYFYMYATAVCLPKFMRLCAEYPDKRKGWDFLLQRAKNLWKHPNLL